MDPNGFNDQQVKNETIEAERFLKQKRSPLKMKRSAMLQDTYDAYVEMRIARGKSYTNKALLIKRAKRKNVLAKQKEESLKILELYKDQPMGYQDIENNVKDESIEKTKSIDLNFKKETEQKRNKVKLESFQNRFSNPFLAMDLAILEKDVPINEYFFRFFKKYAISGLVFCLAIAHQLNKNPFGFARMTFSLGSWLWLRIALFGTISEILIIWLVSLSNKHMNFKRSCGVQSSLCATTTIGLTIANILMFYSPTVWLFMFVLTLIYGAMLHMIAYKKLYVLDERKCVRYVLMSYVYAFILITFWYGLAGADINRIIRCFIKY